MKTFLSKPPLRLLVSFSLGVVCAVVMYTIITTDMTRASFTLEPRSNTPGHDDVHVHADWLVILDHQQYRFTDERYQSPGGNYKHEYLHLHSGDDHVIHRHADGAPLGEFLSSLGWRLHTDETCLQTDLSTEYCADDDNQLVLLVNGEPVTSIADYEFQDEEQLLLYYGRLDDARLADYLKQITDEACLYSGTCPERGVAPPTDCGITCEA